MKRLKFFCLSLALLVCLAVVGCKVKTPTATEFQLSESAESSASTEATANKSILADKTAATETVKWVFKLHTIEVTIEGFINKTVHTTGKMIIEGDSVTIRTKHRRVRFRRLKLITPPLDPQKQKQKFKATGKYTFKTPKGKFVFEVTVKGPITKIEGKKNKFSIKATCSGQSTGAVKITTSGKAEGIGGPKLS